jgi:hypothetical protein
MMSGEIAVGWTFVLSPIYTVISLMVGIVTILVLAVLAMQHELASMNGGSGRPLRRPRGKGAMVSVLLCFGLIVMLRLTDLAYQRPGSLVVSAAAPTAQPTTISTQSTSLAAIPQSSQFYFAGGVSSSRERASINLLNPEAQITNVYLTFFFGAGVSATQTLSIPPTSHQEVPVASLEQSTGSFGLRVVADHLIAAQVEISRGGEPDDLLPESSILSTRWYLAGGRFHQTFRESVLILNPDPVRTAHLVLHLNPQGKATGLAVRETVAPHSQLVVPMHSPEPKEALRLIITSDTPIAVTRIFTFGKNSSSVIRQAGSLTPRKSRIRAGGPNSEGR